MPISFNCPKCNKKLSVQDNMAGKVAKCPCGTQLKIPSPRQPAAPQQQAAPQQATQQQQGQVPMQPLGQPQAPASQSAFGDVPVGTDLNPIGGQQAMPPGGSNDLMSGGDIAAMPMAGAQPMATPGAPAPMEAPQDLQNLNPDFQVQCVQCGQQYPMRPDLFGQTVACRCGAPIRFDDPLGSGGSMTQHDPLGFSEVMETSNQPVAYQSQSQPGESQKQARSREEEVLKMYIKDDGLDDDGSPSAARDRGTYRKNNPNRASFGHRLGALFLDGIVMGVVQQAIFWPIALAIPSMFEIDFNNGTDPDGLQRMMLRMMPFMLMTAGIYILWMILEIAMARTPGKMIVGLKIVDYFGKRPDSNQLAQRALFKYGGNIISMAGSAFVIAQLFAVAHVFNSIGGMLGTAFLVSCLIALGSDRTAWHDKWSSTDVVKAK